MDTNYNSYMNVKVPLVNTTMSIPRNGSLNSSIDHYYGHLESMMSNDAFALGKLGGCNTSSTSFPIESPYLNDNNTSVKKSCYDDFPVFDQMMRRGSYGNSVINPLHKLGGGSSSSPLEIISQSQMVDTKGPVNNNYNGRIVLNYENSTNEEVSSVSELGEMKPRRTPANSRKRRAGFRRKSKDDDSISDKRNEGEDDEDAKRAEKTECKATSEAKFGSNENQKADNDDDQKPVKDYIHVRARRGQATDPHSLAERVRREKISERMKCLQDLVPGCKKVTGKAPMLDEIINYVQSLQRQVEFLSLKLASINPDMDFNTSNILHSKDVFQENGTFQQPLDTSSAAAFYHHQQNVQQHNNNNANVSVDPIGIQFPSVDGFNEFPAFGEDDLQSIFQMGILVQNPVNFHVSDHQTTSVKIERRSSP